MFSIILARILRNNSDGEGGLTPPSSGGLGDGGGLDDSGGGIDTVEMTDEDRIELTGTPYNSGGGDVFGMISTEPDYSKVQKIGAMGGLYLPQYPDRYNYSIVVNGTPYSVKLHQGFDYDGEVTSLTIKNLEYVDVIGFSTGSNNATIDTRKVESFENLFGDGYENVKYVVGINSLPKSGASSLKGMFKGGTSLISVADSNHTFLVPSTDSTILIQNSSNLSEMFMDCPSLKKVLINNYNAYNGTVTPYTNMDSMFENCSSLEEVDFGSVYFNTPVSMKDIFKGCSSLKSITFTTYGKNKDDKADKIILYGLNGKEGLPTDEEFDTNFKVYGEWKITRDIDYTYNPNTVIKNTLTKRENLVNMKITAQGDGNLYVRITCDDGVMIEDARDYDGYVGGKIQRITPVSNNITSIDLSGLDLSMTTSMEGFMQGGYRMSGFKTITFGNLDTSHITTMKKMFYSVEDTVNIDMSGINTSNVENFEYMFSNMNSIEKLDLSSFNVSKANTMSMMFAYSEKLSTIDISGWEIPSEADVSYMFINCKALQKIYLTNSAHTSYDQTTYDKIFGVLSSNTINGALSGNWSLGQENGQQVLIKS